MKHRFAQSTRPQAATGSPMDAALKYLGYSARSVREVERYLDEKQYGEVEVYDTVERLKELGLLDDRAFAEAFIRSRLATKPVSRRKLKEQLLAHELPRDLIDEALGSVDNQVEADNALSVAEKYARQMESLPEDERARRVLQRVLSRGFSYDDAAAAVRACVPDSSE